MFCVVCLTFLNAWGACLFVTYIQLFQLTLSYQRIKLEDKTARLCGIFSELIHENQLCLARTVKIYYGEPFGWKKFQISSRWGSGCFEDGKSGGSSLLPYKKTSVSFIQASGSSCVNWLVNLSSDEGYTNENITWKYKIILFVLLFIITLTRLTSTEMANYPVTKLVGVALKLRKLNEKFAVMRSCSQQNLEFGHFTIA